MVAITDDTGAVAAKFAYTPFGEVTGSTINQPACVIPMGFAGAFGVLREPNGLYYMNARYYDPAMGRFLSEDPLGLGGGDLTLYSYAGNNPVVFVDPSGLCSQGSSLPVYNGPNVGVPHESENWRQDIGTGYITNTTVTSLETVGPNTDPLTYGRSDASGLPYIGLKTGASIQRGSASANVSSEIRLEISTNRLLKAGVIGASAYFIYQTGGLASPVLIQMLR